MEGIAGGAIVIRLDKYTDLCAYAQMLEAIKAGVLQEHQLAPVRKELEAIKPMTAVSDTAYIKNLKPTHFKKGKTKAADAIKGFVMRETKGMAKTEVVQQLVMAELAKE